MRSLVSSLIDDDGAGIPIPTVFAGLSELGVEFRRGMLCLIAAAPGVGKSLLGVTLAVRAGVPTLYHSADTDAYTTSTRIGALLTGHTIGEIEAMIKDQSLRDKLSTLEQIRWSFNASMDISEIVENVKAFDVQFGAPPELIVIDNLSNMFSEEANPYLAHRHNMEALNILARETGACVLVLHHLVGEYESGDVPPPQSSIEGKVAKLPGLVLTLFRGKYGDMGVCVVKNRFGPADPGGRMRCYLPSDFQRVKIG